MSEEEIQKEIIDKFQQDIQKPIQFIDNLLTRNKINVISLTNIKQSLHRIELALLELEKKLGKPIGKIFDSRGIQIDLFKNLTREKAKELTDKRENILLDKACLEILLSRLKLSFPKDESQTRIEYNLKEGNIIKADKKKLSKQQIEIMRVLNEIKIKVVGSEFTDKLCLRIANQINTKAKTPQIKIATIRKQIEKIIDKLNLKDNI